MGAGCDRDARIEPGGCAPRLIRELSRGVPADGKPATSAMWMLVAVIMLTPIAMLVLTLIAPYPAIRWACVGAAVLWVLFNLAGLPHKGAYDDFLMVVSFGLCALIVWYAWTWRVPL